MNTITVKHYLNKRLKPKIIDNKEKYPLYLQINFKGQKAQIKSNAFTEFGYETYYLTDIEFKNIDSFSFSFLEDEKKIITYIIEILNEKNKEIDFSNFSNQIKELSKNMIQIIDTKLYELFLIECKAQKKELPKLFYNSEYSLISEVINILNIDFDNDLSEYYNLCKLGFNIFNDLWIKEFKEVRYMKLYEWKFKNGKKEFIKKGLLYYSIQGNEKETKEYLNNKVILAIEKLIL